MPSPIQLVSAGALALASVVVAGLSRPLETAGLDHFCNCLGTDQRDFRVFNNFSDASANDNLVPHPNFPGHTGAVVALWKSVIEWGSGHYAGDGEGDPTQAKLGTGSSNFDSTFQGEASSIGGITDNVASAVPFSGGTSYAFLEIDLFVDFGWRMRFFDGDHVWADGPGNIPGTQADIQGVGCHQFGHALGLDHSADPQATMSGFLFPNDVSARSINGTDVDALQAIYGVKSLSKPEITALSGSTNVGETLVIEGLAFIGTTHEVWFTAVDSDGTAAKVTGAPSMLGGTQIAVTIPAGVEDGTVNVRRVPGGDDSISNPFPIDIDSSPAVGVFVAVGAGIGGALGAPVLSGSGDLAPGSPTGFTVDISGCPPSAFGIWFWSLGDGGSAPFKQGTFYPVPLLFQVGFSVDGTGAATLPLAFDASVPGGIHFTTQYWCVDPSAPAGASGTNGLRMDLPP